MAERNPKLELLSNVPKTVKLLYDPKTMKELNNEFGTSWMTTVEHEGTQYTWFINSASLHDNVLQYRKDDEITVCKVERKNENTKKVYHEFTVNGAIFDDAGKKTIEPPPSIHEDKNALEAYRSARKNRMWLALEDAHAVVTLFNESKSDFLTHEDLRAIAISFMIDEQRQR